MDGTILLRPFQALPVPFNGGEMTSLGEFPLFLSFSGRRLRCLLCFFFCHSGRRG